jgi:Zn-dependent protease with chaperone function
LGIAVWLLIFISVLFASAAALGVSIWAIAVGWIGDSSAHLNLLQRILIGAAPWLLMALAGIILSLANLKVDPLIKRYREASTNAALVGKQVQTFEGVPVQVVELPVWLSGYASRPYPRILISRIALYELSADETLAVLWHEIAHRQLRHNQLKFAVTLLMCATSFVRASRVMEREVALLCEDAADMFAAKRTSSALVEQARGKFL